MVNFFILKRIAVCLVFLSCCSMFSFIDVFAGPLSNAKQLTTSQPGVLPSNFSLTYKVEQKDVRSSDMRKSLQSILPADSHIDYTKTIPTSTYIINVSGSGKRILVQESHADLTSVHLYDGSSSSDIEFGHLKLDGVNHKIRTVYIMPGYLAIFQTGVLPLPGLGFEGIPLLKAAEVKNYSSSNISLLGQSPVVHRGGNGEIIYQPSMVNLLVGNDGKPRVDNCTVDSPYGVEQRWGYQNYVPLGSVSVASKMTLTDYQGYGDNNGKPVRGPSTIYSFSLLSSSTQGASKEIFDLKYWLHSGDNVEIMQKSGKNMFFPYQANRGTLDEQLNHAKYEAEHQQDRSNSGNGKSFSGGLLVLMALACMVMAWVVSKRRANRDN